MTSKMTAILERIHARNNMKTWTPRHVRFQELHRLLNHAKLEQAKWDESPNRWGGAAAQAIRSVNVLQWEAELRSFPREYHESVT